MNLPEYWLHQDRFPDAGQTYANEDFVNWVTKIQIDAYLAGLRKAVEITSPEHAPLILAFGKPRDCQCEECETARRMRSKLLAEISLVEKEGV